MAYATGPLARKLGRYITLSTAETHILDRLESDVVIVERQSELISEGEEERRCYVVLDGWAACYKQVPDGRRQIINFMIPGDFLGLRSVLLQVSDHSVVAVSKLRLARFSVTELRRILAEQARICAAIFWALSRDEAIIVEHLVDLGRRNALERLAHLIIELGERLRQVGLGHEHGYHCPLRQEDFADALGLTTIHINRSFRELRERQLVTLSRRNVRINDREKLLQLVEFSDHYLHPGTPL